MKIIDKYDLKTTPQMVPVKAENIPKKLKKTANWLNWKWEFKGKKWTKPPVNGTSTNGNLSFEKALQNTIDDPHLGLGISLQGNNLCGLDLDNVIGENGKLNKSVKKHLNGLSDSYIEYSPSGKGLRIIGTGTPNTVGSSKSHCLEVYNSRRYLTITGWIYGKKKGKIKDITEAANDFAQEIAGKHEKKESARGNKETGPVPRKIISELFVINPDDREKWLKIGTALKTEYGDEAFDIFDRWSSTSDHYGDLEDNKYQWDSFKAGEYNIESLFFEHNEELKRIRDESGSLSAAVREVIDQLGDNITYSDVYRELSITESSVKKAVRTIFSRMRDEGLIVKSGIQWLKKDEDVGPMSPFEGEDSGEVKLPLPFDLNSFTVIRQGMTVIIAGDTNAGKTGIALNICALIASGQAENPYPDEKVRYLNSEMSKSELKNRTLETVAKNKSQWDKHIEFYSCSKMFDQHINPNGLNIIDYLEVHEDFFLTGQMVAKIDKALENGIAIILIQKKQGTVNPKGGAMVKEKARLVINLNYHDGGALSVKIAKLKEPRNFKDNKNGQAAFYEFDKQGCPKLLDSWRYIKKLETKDAEF